MHLGAGKTMPQAGLDLRDLFPLGTRAQDFLLGRDRMMVIYAAQFSDRIGVFGGVQQIRGHHGVHIDLARPAAFLQHPADFFFYVMTDELHLGIGKGLEQPFLVRTIDPDRLLFVCLQGKADERLVPGQTDRQLVYICQIGIDLFHRLKLMDSRQFGRLFVLVFDLCGKAFQQALEIITLQQIQPGSLMEMLLLPGRDFIGVQRYIGTNGGKFQAEPGLVRKFFQVLGCPRRFDLIRVQDGLLDGAELGNNLGCRLFTDRRNAGDIVGTITHQGLHLQIARRIRPVFGDHVLRIVGFQLSAALLGFGDHDLDLIRNLQPPFRRRTDGAETLHIHCGDDGIQVGVFIQKLFGAFISIAKAVDDPVRAARNLLQPQLFNRFPISFIAPAVRSKMLCTGNQADGTASFLI